MKKILIMLLALSCQCLAFEPKVVSTQKFDLSNFDDSMELSDDGILLLFDSEKRKKNCKSVVSLFCDSVIAPQSRISLSKDNSQLSGCLETKDSIAFAGNNLIYLVTQEEYTEELFVLTDGAGACRKKKISLNGENIQFVGFSNEIALFLYSNSGGGWEGFIQYDIKKMVSKKFINYTIFEDMMTLSENGILIVNDKNLEKSCVFKLQLGEYKKEGCFNAFPNVDSVYQTIISPSGRYVAAAYHEEDEDYFFVRIFDLMGEQ